MAIESDQLVFDYLSRVGDLAQQRQLSSKTRMHLVAELRADIDRRRAAAFGSKAPGDSPAGVRRILSRLGTPEEVVARAAGGASTDQDRGPDPAGGAGGSDDSGGAPVDVSAKPEPRPRHRPSSNSSSSSSSSSSAEPAPFVPEQRADDQDKRPRRRFVPRSRLTKDAAPPAEPPPVTSTPPHLAGEDEVGPSGSEPDWWRIDNSPFGVSDSVPGFVGGVEIPEILRPPRDESKEDEKAEAAGGGAKAGPSLKKSGKTGKRARVAEDESDEEEEGDADDEVAGPRRMPFLRRADAARGAPSLSNPWLLLAAVLLVVGAALGNWIALGLGWAIAYTSRRLTQNEAKFAALGIPGLAAAAGVVWLWGRFDGRWGEAVPKGATADALAQTWPWVVRLAAVASALFLVWRSQRQRPQ